MGIEKQVLIVRDSPKRGCRLATSIFSAATLLLLLVFTGSAAYFFLQKWGFISVIKPSTADNDALFSRINCFPERQGYPNVPWYISKDQCLARNCTFDLNTNNIPEVPPCYMPPNIGYFVKADATNKSDPSTLALLYLKPLSMAQIFDPPSETLTFVAQIINNNHLQIKIIDAENERYTVPVIAPMDPAPGVNKDSVSFTFGYTANPFTFYVIRKSTGTVLFNTSMGGLVYSDRFLQISTRLPSKNFYGLGEHEHPSLLHDLYYKTWAMFARDQPGLGENLPLYGVHPFYMVLENDGNANGVFLLNSNAMEFSLIPAPGVIIRTIGGLFDIHIYTGPTPDSVIQQHTELVGRPFIPPYWALGFQLSKYGYNALVHVQEAVNRTRQFGIPLDVIYSDIDHMDERKDFTIDQKNFGDLPAYLRQEKDTNGLHSVIIIDPAVTNNATNYDPWNVLSGNDTFVKWPNNTVMLGYVWPAGKVAFPDHFLDRTVNTWGDLIVRHSKIFPFDGLWTDMNEPSNFGTNEYEPFNWPPNLPPWSLKCPKSNYEDPPYRTYAISRYDGGARAARLSDKTLCMEAVTADGRYRMYDVHNLYGFLESNSTLKAIRKAYPGRRGFVLSRSTFAGSGAFATHWLGDNVAKWEHLQHSIIAMLELSLFGIAHTGPDICGFIGTPSVELCKRWMQTGAFYPYSRNHNDLNNPPQDPGFFGPDVANTSRDYMLIRYQMLPYMYTLFYLANTRGSTVARPVFFEFPTDNNTWAIDRQFMLGRDFLVSPILDPGKNDVTAYIPHGFWWQWTTGSVHAYDFCQKNGQYVTIDVSGPALLQRDGSIVASQGVNTGNVVSTKFTRQEPFYLTIVPSCSDKSATGLLFWDDGDSLGTVDSGSYLLVSFNSTMTTSKTVLTVNVDHSAKDSSLGAELSYAAVAYVNFPGDPKSVTLDCGPGATCPKVTTIYNTKIQVLTVILGTDKQPLTIRQNFTLTISMV